MKPPLTRDGKETRVPSKRDCLVGHVTKHWQRFAKKNGVTIPVLPLYFLLISDPLVLISWASVRHSGFAAISEDTQSIQEKNLQ